MTVLFVTHDIGGAVYLGRRVLVLSASPTVVCADLGVELFPERNQLTTRAGPRFTELRSRVFALIRSGAARDPLRKAGHPARGTDS